MKTTHNEYNIVTDRDGSTYLEIMVEKPNWEIWARISMLSYNCTEVTLYDGDNEVDIKSDVLRDGATFRTLEDLQNLREEMEDWKPSEPDYAEIIESRNEALTEY